MVVYVSPRFIIKYVGWLRLHIEEVVVWTFLELQQCNLTASFLLGIVGVVGLCPRSKVILIASRVG